MSAHCCDHDTPGVETIVNLARYRKILWIALIVNATMFLVEIGAGVQAGSLSLLADAVDFAGDALNSMIGFGLYVLGAALWSVWHGEVPQAMTMGAVALLALLANVVVAWMLYAFRDGDANMRSVWLCSRNDAIGNVAVFMAALGVFGTGSAWPDLVVASLMAALALHGGWTVLRQARGELGEGSANADHHGHVH